MLIADVVVVGGGPAGAAAAITLGRAGREVVLVDRAAFPRDKCCGDGLTAAALRLYAQLGLEPAAIPSWQRVDDVIVRSPSGREIDFPLTGRPLAAVARRSELDATFLDVARKAGVEVCDGHALLAASSSDDRVVLDVDGLGEVHARYAIGADGMWSPLRKALVGGNGNLGEWHAFRQYFRDVSGPAAKKMFVWFEPGLLPAYAWSFPLADGRANVGFGIERGGRRRVGDMGRMWAEVLCLPHVRSALGPGAEPEAPHRAWPIPARVDEAVLSSGRALFVGDAAAASDRMTGEGIAQALLTGVLAGEAVLAGGPDRSEAVTSRYEAAVRRELVADHRMSVLLMRALRHRKGARAAVRIAGASAWTRRNFARWLMEDYPRAVLVTPRRWPSLFAN